MLHGLTEKPAAVPLSRSKLNKHTFVSSSESTFLLVGSDMEHIATAAIREQRSHQVFRALALSVTRTPTRGVTAPSLRVLQVRAQCE